MTEALWLQEARNVLQEPAASFHFDFADEDGRAFRQLIQSGYLAADPGTLWHCPVGGCIMGSPDFNLPDMDVDEWLLEPSGSDGWAYPNSGCPTLFPRDDREQRTRCLSFEGSGAWRMTTRAVAPAGTPMWLRWATYDTQGAQSLAPTIWFGGIWKLQLADHGPAVLYRSVIGGTGWKPVVTFDWLTEASYTPSVHWLWVYELGPRLIIRSVQQATDGRPRGIAHIDQFLPPTDTEPGAELEVATDHALKAGRWCVQGAGRVTIAMGMQRFREVTSRLYRPVADAVGADGEGKTTACRVTISGVINPGITQPAPGVLPVTVTTVDQDEGVWPQYPAADLAEAKQGFRWEIAWPNTADASALITAIDLTLPATYGSDNATATDLLTLDGVSSKQIRFTREPDLAREEGAVGLMAHNYDLPGMLNENMPIRYVRDGQTMFRGLTTGGEWQTVVDPRLPDTPAPVDPDTGLPTGDPTLGDPLPSIGHLSLPMQGLWKRFGHAKWAGGRPGDGRLLTDVVTEVLAAAGIPAADVVFPEDLLFRIPKQPQGQPPALLWRAGSNIDQILCDLRDKFFGTRYSMGFRRSDGRFEVKDLMAPGAQDHYFYETSDLAAAAGLPEQIIQVTSYRVTRDPTEMANIVTVIGQDANGLPLMARATDWLSIRGYGDGVTYPLNFVGEPWPLIVADPGLATQEAVNYVCTNVYNRVRVPHVIARWRSVIVDATPGDTALLEGPHYGGTYRLTGVEIERAAEGDAHRPSGQASYTAELLS